METAGGAPRSALTPCLYCSDPAESLEHAIPEAMGGRLAARILCGNHNNEIGAVVDRPLCEWFAPLTNATAVVRQRGGIGTSFQAPIVDGSATTRVGPDYSVESPFTIQKDPSGRPIRASGELSAVKKLAKTAGIQPGEGGWQMIETRVAAPVVSIKLGLLDEAHAGLVKIALHFVAIARREWLSPAVIRGLEPIIFSGAPAHDLLTFTRLGSPYFIDDERPHHEVAVFDGGDHATVAIGLYGVWRLLVRLDAVVCARPLRYTQYLDGTPPDVSDLLVAGLKWTRMAEDEEEAFKAESKGRLSEVFRRQTEAYINQCINEVLLTAFGRYVARPTREGLAPHLDAELQTRILDTDLRHDAVRQVCAKVRVPPPPRLV